ncbi:MAG TPA: hypothetical protein VIS48_09275 [Candidatus Kryptonia bacterium]
MRVLYLGEMGDAISNLIALSKVATDIVVLNTSLTNFYEEPPSVHDAIGKKLVVYNLYEPVNPKGLGTVAKLRKILRYLSGFNYSFFSLFALGNYEKKFIKNVLDKEKVDLVFAAWGISVIADIRFLRAVDPTVPIVHYLPTFPTSQLSKIRESLELYMFRRNVPSVQGFITGSEPMKSFFTKKFGMNGSSMFVGPIYYASEYFARNRMPLMSDKTGEPHLVFPGTNDFSKTYNDVTAQIVEVTRCQIHVHCGQTTREDLGGHYVHFFERFDTPDLVNGKFAEFMTQFDGCLVLYNGNSKRLKLTHSIPQRFLAAFIAGIPIFMKRGTFSACEEIVTSSNIGLVYEDAEELRQHLLDHRWMDSVRRNALEISSRFAFEYQKDSLFKFLSSLINR